MIKCALTTDELEFVYGTTKQAIERKLDAGNPFNVDNYMKYLYERIQKVSDRDRAAQFLAFTPAIIEAVVLNNFTENLDQIEGYEKISILKAKWADPKSVIKNVINALEQTKTNLKIARLINQQSKGVVQDNNTSKFDYNMVPRYRALNILSTTLPAFKPGTTKFEQETPDAERRSINNTISAIAATIALEDTVLKHPNYQGVDIKLKAVNLGQFVNGTYAKTKLDTTTQREIARSLDIQNPLTKGKPKTGVDQVQDRVIVLVTDSKGTPLSFDANGNIVTEASPNSTYVYQMMRSIRKSGNNFSIRDIYGMEDKVLSSSEIAAERSAESKVSFDKALKQVNSEFQEYYNLKNKALDEDVMLDFIGMTEGISIEKNVKEASLETLLANDILTEEDIESIRTLSVPEAGYKKGTAVIEIKDEPYKVDRGRMTSDLASQIGDVLFSNMNALDKIEFINQFIPNEHISDFSKRHDIVVDDATGNIQLVIYDRTKSKKSPRNTIYDITLRTDGSILSNDNTILSDTSNVKNDFIYALTNTFPDGKPMFVHYSEFLLKNNFGMDVWNGNRIETGNYLDLIKSLNPTVYISSTEEGFYNKQILFQANDPKTELANIPKNLPLEKRFNQLTEEQYLGDLLLQQTPDGKSVLKDEYKGKLIYSTLGLFSPEPFKDTNVIGTNDITVDLIPSIQMGNGEVFRERNEGESIEEYIFAFYKTGYKAYYLDPAVTNRIKQLTEQGVTVVTETRDRIKDADLVVLGDRNNPAVESYNLKESFFQKELNATEEYIVNLTKEPVSKRISPYQNKQIVVEKANSIDTEKSNDANEDGWELLRSGKLNSDKLSAADIKRADTFWNKSPFGKSLQKSISLNKAANIVNSDAFANFVISGATLMNPNVKGTINISKSRGSMVDVYHEAFHAFTQLYLTKEQKTALYEEVLNYTDKNGNKPYEGKSFLEIEEILAEDFRTYMKKNVVKPNSPMRNSIFRKIVEILKKIFGAIIPGLKNVQLDIMSIPTVKDLYENLNFGNEKFFNKYEASIDNARFFELERGITYAESINNEQYKRTALSKQDSDLISSSIDSIISDLIDERYNLEMSKTTLEGKALEKFESTVKGLSLSALLNPKSRVQTYKKVLEKLKDRLAVLNKEYTDSVGKTAISKITTFKELQDASVANLKTKSGINKYFLLKSQIDSFRDFDSYFKRGTRIKGEEWKGIKILGDYFTHSTIKDNSREGKREVPAQIIVISRLEDAEAQYENYIDGKAKEFTGFEQTSTEDSDLTYEQENILDNIRILETAIDQFGDPNYIIDEVKPTGVIAYHLNHSNFEIDNVKYILEQDENEVAQSSEGTLFEEPFQKSLLDLADKEVIYVLKSLHKIENGNVKLNKLGFKENADFRKVWNTLSKIIGGVQDRQEAYDNIKEESENFPELEQLWKIKLPAPNNTKSSYAFDISSSFWQTFARPSVKFWQLTANIDMIYDKGMLSTTNVEFITNESTIELNKILSTFESRFKISRNPYMVRLNDQPARLDVAKLYNTLIKKGKLNKTDRLAFLSALGFKLDNTKKLQEALGSRELSADISNLVLLTKNIRDILEQQESKTVIQKTFLKMFSSNPIGTLRNSDLMSKAVTFLPGFKDANALRGNSIVNNLAKVQSSFGFDTPGDTVKLPDGNNAQPVANHSNVSSTVLGLNALDDLNDAYVQNHHLSFLNPNVNRKDLPYNPLSSRNKIIQTLFPGGSKRDKSKTLNLILLGGTETITKEVHHEQYDVISMPSVSKGINTGDLSSKNKLFQDYIMMLQKGVGEFIRHSDKKSAFGLRIDKKKSFNGVKTGNNSDLWIDVDFFSSAKGDQVALEAFVLDYIASEFDRIQYFEQNPKILETTVGYNDYTSTRRKKGLSFIAMDSLLTQSAKTFLYEKAKDGSIQDIIDVIKNDPTIYSAIRNSVAEYFRQKSMFIKEELGGALRYVTEYENYDLNTLAKAYTYNDFINKIEMSNLLNGDMAQFKDPTKRVPGSTSDGDGFLADKGAQDFINKYFQYKDPQNKIKTTYAQKMELSDFKFDGTLNAGVLKDPKRESVYLKEMQDTWESDYRKAVPKLSESEIAYRLEKDSEAYIAMEEADGAAYLTFDAYRVLRKLGNKWSIDQENLYQDIKNGKSVNAASVSKFFPVYKLHNYGGLMNAGRIATTSMFKFAVAPIIPAIAKPGTELYKLHMKMMESNIQMVTFKSGSKVSSISSKPLKAGQADDIFAKVDVEKDVKLNVKDRYVEVSNEKAPIAINKIHLKNLKDVTPVADVLKNTITVGTQSRVIVESQLYHRGKVIEKKNAKLAKEYREIVDNLTEVLEAQLLDEIGFTVDPQGKYVPSSGAGLSKLTTVIRQELDAKGSPTQLQNIIDVTPEGRLKVDFSVHPEAQVVEQILVNRISKAISVQKTKGESDVQVPSTFYNGVWSSKYEQDAAIIKNELEIQKYLGTNNLPFYRKGKNGTLLAKIAIPLNGDFVNLLNLEDPNNSGTIKENGGIDRLNELLKDEDWMKEHGEKVTVTGPRIPTDDTNLMEGFEIWHFLDASAGSTVVVPTEIVAKAGSDFDVDKLFFSFPHINEDGTLPEETLDFEATLAKRKEKKQGVKDLLNKRKKVIQNKLIQKSVEILKLPELYGALTKPAGIYLFADQATPESNSYKKVHASISTNPTKIFEYEYNNRQHELLMGGSAVVGLSAKKNKQHILNKSIGAKMPKKFIVNKYLLREMKMKFPVNRTDKGNISLSDVLNQDGVSISEILSHGLQGILDRGNNDFPVRAGLIKEAVPVLFRLIETGVSLPQAIKFIQQPLIAEYLNNVAESKGLLAQLQGANLSKSEIINRTLVPWVDKSAAEYYNTKVMSETLAAAKRNPNETFEVNLFGSNPQESGKKVKGKDLYKWLKDNKIALEQVTAILDKNEKIVYLPYNPQNPSISYKTYHLGEYFWQVAYGSKVPTAEDLSTPESDIKQVALLFEFLNIEDQFKGMENFEINFNPDTGLLMNVEGALERKRFVEAVKLDTKVDIETIDKYLNASVISSMYKTEIFNDIVTPRFNLRLNKVLSEQLMINYSDNKQEIKNRYSQNETEAFQKYTNAFNNGVIDYIYQNILSNYIDPFSGLPVELPKVVRQRTVNKKTLPDDKVVVFKEKTVDVDIAKIKQDFKDNAFMSSKNITELDDFERSPFPTVSSYIRYVIEREYFREQYKEFKDSKGFEERISKRALATSFNPGYVKGDAGMGPVKYSYTQDIMEFIENPENATIVQNFPVLQHLKPSFYMARKGYQLLELDNKNLIDNDTAEDYAKQLKKLGDPNFRIIPEDLIRDNKITDLFKNFSLMAIYQQGTGKSGLSFIKALDPENFVKLLERTVPAFIKTALSNSDKLSIKERQLNLFKTISDSVLQTTTYKDYITEPSEFAGSKDKKSKQENDENELNPYISMTNDTLYNHYKIALSSRALDDAMSEDGLGTATVLAIENELLKRGLPSITDLNINSTAQRLKVNVDYSKSWKGDLEYRAVYTDEGVNTMRTKDDKDGDENFGNPFSESGYSLFKLNSVEDAVKAYKDWLINDMASTEDYNIDPKEFVKAIIKSYGGKPTSKGMLTIDGQHYYIPNISIIPKGSFTDAFIGVGNDEVYLGSSKDGNNFVSEDYYLLSDLALDKREWILGEIATGKLDNKTLLYDGKLAERGKGTHAQALVEVVKELRNDVTIIKPGIEIRKDALTKKEQLELFSILKPFIEEQAAKTNKGKDANVMLGLELRWDYKNNNPGVKPLDIGPIINPASSSKFGYYTLSINGKPLGKISPRIRELMTKATGVDTTHYDGAIINLYTDSTFVSSHDDVDESIEAIKYPVVVANIGGAGNFAVTKESDSYIKNSEYSRDDMHTLNAGDAYVFGINGQNRKVYHRTFPNLGTSFLPEITTEIDGKTYPAGSYRLSITMRRVKPIKGTNIPKAPKILTPGMTPESIIAEGLGQTKMQFETLDPALETFYANLTTSQTENENLPSIEYAQEFFNNAPHAYKNINEYIEALKCL